MAVLPRSLEGTYQIRKTLQNGSAADGVSRDKADRAELPKARNIGVSGLPRAWVRASATVQVAAVTE
jgi:hypothetical protein